MKVNVEKLKLKDNQVILNGFTSIIVKGNFFSCVFTEHKQTDLTKYLYSIIFIGCVNKMTHKKEEIILEYYLSKEELKFLFNDLKTSVRKSKKGYKYLQFNKESQIILNHLYSDVFKKEH
jgi:hypothetical protein